MRFRPTTPSIRVIKTEGTEKKVFKEEDPEENRPGPPSPSQIEDGRVHLRLSESELMRRKVLVKKLEVFPFLYTRRTLRVLLLGGDSWVLHPRPLCQTVFRPFPP